MRNKYPGTCYRCGRRVGVNEGYFQLGRKNINVKIMGTFLVQHVECSIKYSGTSHCWLDKKMCT